MPPPIPPPRRPGPPPAPKLDADRVAKAVAPLGPALREAVEYMAETGPDGCTDAACRVVAWTLGDMVRAASRRDTAGVERWAGWLCDYLPTLPDKIAEAATPGGWSATKADAAIDLCDFEPATAARLAAAIRERERRAKWKRQRDNGG